MQYEALIKKIQGGDQAALEDLWNQVKHFAITIVKRYSPTAFVDSDDLLQCAFLGMRSAAYAHDGKYKILSLMAWMIRNECRHALYLDRRREPDFVSYDAPIGEGSEDGSFLDNLPDESLPDSTEALELEELRRDVQEAVRALPERQRAIVSQHYFEGLTLEDIAQNEGVTRERIRQIEENAMARLRKDPVLRTAYKPAERKAFLQSCSDMNMTPVEREALWNVERKRKAEQRTKQRTENRLRQKEASEYKKLFMKMAEEGYFTQEEANARLREVLEELGLQEKRITNAG